MGNLSKPKYKYVVKIKMLKINPKTWIETNKSA